MLSVAGMGQPDDRVPHRMAFALVDAAGAQVMPAADVNHGAPLRPGSRCISPKREEVRQRDPRALSVDDVYVYPIASPHVRPNAVPCKLFRAWNAPCSFCVTTSVLFELAREVR